MLTRLSTSGAEPVTLDEVKLAARVDNDLGATSSLDALIGTLITSARQDAEQITQRCYRPQVLRVELLDWPALADVLPVYRPTACTVKYWDGIALADLAGAAYAFAPGGPGGSGTVMAPATSWPQLGVRAVGPRVQIDLTAGPDSPDEVSGCVKTFITACVAAWLNTPEALADKDLVVSPLLARLLDSERLWC